MVRNQGEEADMASMTANRALTFSIRRGWALCVAIFLLVGVGGSQTENPKSRNQFPATHTNWLQYRFAPNHDGVNPFETVLSPTTVGGLTLKWTFTAAAGFYGTPTVVNGVDYVGSDDFTFYALNASTGAKLWSYTAQGVARSSAAVVDGVVYFGADDNNLYAFNATTGVKIWNFTAN